jgi:hypothetical protein
MKRMITTIFLVFFSLLCLAPIDNALILPVGERINPYKRLLWAVGMVESLNKDSALNPKEMAFGRYQIRQIRLDDYYLRTGIRYKLQEMYDSVKAEKVFLYYCNSPYEFEKIARCWNGGTNGMRYKQTYQYYLKVHKTLLLFTEYKLLKT